MSTVAYSNASGESVSVIIEVVPGGFSSAALQAAMQYAGSQGSLVPITGLGDAAGKEVTAKRSVSCLREGLEPRPHLRFLLDDRRNGPRAEG